MEKSVRLPIRAGGPPNWLLIGLLAVLVRLLFAVIIGRFWHIETWEYETIADHLLQGHGFIYGHLHTLYRSYCEPLYPFLVAGIYALTHHSHWVLLVVQSVLYGITAVLAGRCAELATGNSRVALLAGLLVALDPALILYATKQHPLVLDALFMTLVALSSLLYAQKPTSLRAAGIGLSVGLCTLTRPTIVAVIPLLIWWIGKKQIGRILLMLGVSLLVVSPWILRNYKVQGRWMLTRSNTPFVFWLGNNPNATGSALDAGGEDLLKRAPPEFLEKIYRSDERTQNRLFGEAAWAYVRSDPWGFVRRAGQKWLYFWWFSPQAGLSYPSGWLRLYRVWWGMLLLAGGWGALRLRTFSPPARHSMLFLLGTALIVSGVQSLFYVEGRHRLAIEPIVTGLVAFGLYDMMKRLCR